MYRIMIVDDNPSIIESLKCSVRWDTYNCVICGMATNAVQGLQKISSEKPDILITDIMMPGLNGLEMIGKVKVCSPKTETIIITGYSNFSFAQAAIRLGVVDFILKPIDNNDLIAAVQKVLNQISGSSGPHLESFEPGSLEYIALGTKQHASSQLIREVLEYIDNNLNRPLALGEIANEFLITSSYLSNAFKKDTGRSFVDYVNLRKMCRAKELLKNPKLKVYEVANLLGYRNYAYFYQVYKKYCGSAPRADLSEREDAPVSDE